ncbi:non-hydrolyzing UDP-N-acetylglucosamine 2-epimerase [Christiangramia sp. SM2212]|uniref:UDP-N-acetylglucosamine 2-epimerase (Non-hydrolyzing) n=1 Tax=Christiangramia sediminicola TaxID=3073267 RepID=A0ABU1ENA7_9FLAO|nr:UDP-N-acetylglucosamine 2-epimerase (non-hydrolyzing) [Christiangramia sp. SM2212]MDR5589708.1 UDP-N-acetylglucosamine 2-epimerase (non-hydrolyzing) [Christiangramia sp. SM2212]
MYLDLIAGTRPNFVKIASIIHAIDESELNFTYRLIHTGQHYDKKLSTNFFKDLKLPEPDHNLGVGSGSQAKQTAEIMTAYEKLLEDKTPDICIVVGDVTSSMACAITAKKMLVKVAHIEAGLRSYDWEMPEEINRVLIDSIADYFFTTTIEAKTYLLSTGKDANSVYHVGNTMIDTLVRFKQHFRKPDIWNRLDLKKDQYLVLTMHRPSNVDGLNHLEKILKSITSYRKDIPIIFPVHPRTENAMKRLKFDCSNLFLSSALDYLEFNFLVQNSKAVITDSGGITEETTVLGIPCLTIRENTERPETTEIGTNEIVGTDPKKIEDAFSRLFNNNWRKGSIPNLWDGNTGLRILRVLNQLNS